MPDIWKPTESKSMSKSKITRARRDLRTFVLLTSLLCVPAFALNWPQFRGASGDGCAPSADPQIAWSESTNVIWKVPLTGRGRSSPVTFGDRIFLTAAVEQGVVRTKIEGDDMQTAEHVS